MFYLYSIILGFLQGITEFLPISSSGHLILLHDLFKFDFFDNIVFDIALHIGTVIALLVYYWATVNRYFLALMNVFSAEKRKINQTDLKDVMLLIYATILAMIIGLFLDKFVESALRNILVVAIALFVGGVLILITDKYFQETHDFTGLNIGGALYIGFAQALALIPGVSRSAITIIAGRSLKLKREEAAKFSFLLSIPIVLCAGLYKMLSVSWSNISAEMLLGFFLGIVSSAFTGYFVIKYFLKYVSNHKFTVFAWYRIALALLLFGFLLK